MSYDPTENMRRQMLASQKAVIKAARELLSEEEIVEGIRKNYPDACNTKELQERYEVRGFLAPFVSVTRKTDGVKGMMEFTHSPRMYYNFIES